MQMPIVQLKRASAQQFVNFWSSRYVDPREELYEKNIGRELTKTRILQLFHWKNGTPLSVRKEASVEKNFSDRIPELEQLPPDIGAGDFLKRFAGGGAIWRIFWLHCWKPGRFPIYD